MLMAKFTPVKNLDPVVLIVSNLELITVNDLNVDAENQKVVVQFVISIINSNPMIKSYGKTKSLNVKLQ